MNSLQNSYRECIRITRNANSSFPFAFRFLPRDQNLAMHALYAFCRVTDDLSDSQQGSSNSEKIIQLQQWQTDIFTTQANDNSQILSHRKQLGQIIPAIQDTIQKFNIPKRYFEMIIDGAIWDCDGKTIQNFAELERYCEHVASAVGYACLQIWGCRDIENAGKKHAHQLGLAMQLTNIVRDIREDALNGRVYLPADELRHISTAPTDWQIETEGVQELMQRQVDRVKHYFQEAEKLFPLLPLRGRYVCKLLANSYRLLLKKIEKKKLDVFAGRVRVGKARKVLMLISSIV